MKGVVFVELLAMAEEAFGEDAVDQVLDKTDLLNGGAFTAVGNYPCSELIKIVEGFSAYSGLSQEALQRQFGHWLFRFFGENYAEFFAGKATSFEMLEAVDGEIHVEVLKLYPDAELPRFQTRRIRQDKLEMVYSSPRPLVDFCHGLIEACVARFDEQAEIDYGPTSDRENSTTFVIDIARS